jgi:hypothetical protein
MKKKETIETPVVAPVVETKVQTRKEYLLELYQILKDEGIRSISDLEVKIANS